MKTQKYVHPNPKQSLNLKIGLQCLRMAVVKASLLYDLEVSNLTIRHCSPLLFVSTSDFSPTTVAVFTLYDKLKFFHSSKKKKNSSTALPMMNP